MDLPLRPLISKPPCTKLGPKKGPERYQAKCGATGTVYNAHPAGGDFRGDWRGAGLLGGDVRTPGLLRSAAWVALRRAMAKWPGYLGVQIRSLIQT